jgi:hypothetical protein
LQLYIVKRVIASFTRQSLLNFYVFRVFRALRPRSMACRRSTNEVLILELHTDALSTRSTAR